MRPLIKGECPSHPTVIGLPDIPLFSYNCCWWNWRSLRKGKLRRVNGSPIWVTTSFSSRGSPLMEAGLWLKAISRDRRDFKGRGDFWKVHDLVSKCSKLGGTHSCREEISLTLRDFRFFNKGRSLSWILTERERDSRDAGKSWRAISGDLLELNSTSN